VKIETPNYAYRFRAGWENGVAQVMEPISFDFLERSHLVDTATTWTGRLATLSRSNEFQFTAVVAPPPVEDLQDAFKQALGIVAECPQVMRLVNEAEMDAFLAEVEQDVRLHPARSL
jgi:hypothetical protein